MSSRLAECETSQHDSLPIERDFNIKIMSDNKFKCCFCEIQDGLIGYYDFGKFREWHNQCQDVKIINEEHTEHKTVKLIQIDVRLRNTKEGQHNCCGRCQGAISDRNKKPKKPPVIENQISMFGK